MKPPIKLGPRAFLKKLGFQFNKKTAYLDRLLLSQLGPLEQKNLEKIWMKMQLNEGHISDLYSVPRSENQAAALFSHDANRLVGSMLWFSELLENLRPKKVLDAGCGAGYLLRYLHAKYPKVEFSGIDRQNNLLSIAAVDPALKLYNASYEEAEISERFDLIICNFGWDNEDLPGSSKPHSIEQFAGNSFCPGCSNDQIPFFETILSQLKHWLVDKGRIATIGRLPDFGSVRALYKAAENCDLQVTPGGFGIETIKNAEYVEKFPRFLLETRGLQSEGLELIARQFAKD